MVYLDPHLPIVSEIKLAKTSQASIFTESKYYLLMSQILCLISGGTCQSTQGSTSEQGTSARWTVHQYTKGRFVSCGKRTFNVLCQILIWERVAKSIPNYSVEEQKNLLLSICSSSTRIVFCLLISKENLEKKYINACLPLNIANNKNGNRIPWTQETK